MKSLLKPLSFIAFLVLISSHAGAAEYGTFDSFYSAGGLGFWGWTGIIAGTIAVGVLTFVTFGGGAAAAPAWMAAVGTWIGSTVGLSGIAAANFGLALLGGGAVAAGGLGVAGGVTVLATALAFSTDIVVSYSIETALEKYTHSKFIEANKKMLTLPVPRNTKGGKAYKSVMEYLKKEFKSEEAITAETNQRILLRAIEILNEKMYDETDNDYRLKDSTLLALLHLQTHNYTEARNAAQNAISIGIEADEKHNMPYFIYALAQLADPDQGCSAETLRALRIAFLQEPNNKLIPIMTGSCMDRLMYDYHYGKLSAPQLSDFCNLIANQNIDKKLAAQSLEIFATRSLIELKRNQQDIRTVARDSTMIKQKKIRAELHKRLERHKLLVELLWDTALPQIMLLEKKLTKDSKVRPEEFGMLLYQYREEISELQNLIEG